MKRNIEKTLPGIFLLLFIATFAPVISRAQTYEQLDAEAKQAAADFYTKNYKAAYDQTTRELSAGDYGKAIAAANEFLNYAPDQPELVALRARAYAALYGKERIAVTQSAYNEMLSRDSNRNFRSAQEDFLRALESEPQNKSYRADFGWLLYNSGLPTDALRQFKKVLEIDPNFSPAIEGRAKASFFAGDFGGCIEAVNSYLRHSEFQSKDAGWAYLRLGECYAELDDQPNAKANFKKAVGIQPDLQQSWIFLAFTKDGYKCKEEEYAKILQKSGFERYLGDKRWQRCQGRYKKNWLTDVFGGDETLRYYALAYQDINRLRDQYHTIYDSLQEYRRDKMMFDSYKQAVELRRSEQNAAALEAANRSIFLFPKNASILYLRADIIFLHPDRAVKLLAWNAQIPMAQNPAAEFEMRIIRGRVYRQVKDNQRAAVAEFDRAIAVSNLLQNYSADKYAQQKSLADAYYRKGLSLIDDNQPDAAYQSFLQAEKVSRDYVGDEFFAQFAQRYPQFASANQQRINENQARTNEKRQEVARQEAAKAPTQKINSEENALISEYNRLVSANVSNLERQQRNLERKIADYMNYQVAARVFMHRGLYDSCTSVINNHETFRSSLENLRKRAVGKSPAVVSQIDGQIQVVKSAVDKLSKIRSGLVNAL